MTILEQLLAGVVAGAITVGTIGGCVELKAHLEEKAKEEAIKLEELSDVLDGGDVDDFFSTWNIPLEEVGN